MSSFLLDNYLEIYRGAEILAALTGLIFYKKFKSKAARIFIWFLIYVQIIETLAGYPSFIKNSDNFEWLDTIVKDTIFRENYWFYDIFWTIIGSLIISYYFYLVSKDAFLKKIIKVSSLLFLIISIVFIGINLDILFYNLLLSLEILSLILILLVTFSYYVELLNSEKILDFYKSLSFYVASGVLVFWIVITPMSFYEKYYNVNDAAFVALKTYIYLFSIVFMYLAFTIGFIVSKPEHD
ncbi:hypothetical protein [Olleya aquimaris]|uniref:Uncharacterized protein n=1 Tax=Olleya aquimaris TaxID=639310 RepID=A0A327RJL2_9FLAO|nr:hypothetical protein [Olleya aquimaris]RAJ17190.1 hypothetical protein LY08_00971 [Olleya aquimaris]